jgi:sensor histidine kinase YesM
MLQDNFKKAFYALGIWLIPVLLILVEAAIFLNKANWKSEYLPYFITFWVVRAVLAPLIVLYTLRFWRAHKKVLFLFVLHGAGFLLFSALFWSSSYLILHDVLDHSVLFGVQRTSTDIGIFGMIVDNSISTNSIVYVSTVGFCYIWEFFKQNISINKRAMDLERSLLTSRLELLKGQLNTHFLFNTLHTISSFVVRKQNDEANKMLVRLSDLLRFALKENTDQLIPLHKEIELLQLYIDIQQTRFKERLQLNMQIDNAVKNNLVPSFILQPIVENAVKYAVEPYSGTGMINIDINRLNGTLNIVVKDNGKRPFSEINFDSGIGLSNTKERLKQLYGKEDAITIRPNVDGFGVIVNLEIPHQTIENAQVENISS